MVGSPVSPYDDNTVKACASVIDVFCGVGDLTHGFKIEGFPVVCGIDVDEACRYPFETNNDAPFICRDVAKLSSQEVAREFYPAVYPGFLQDVHRVSRFPYITKKTTIPSGSWSESFPV
uniref:C-5 cytosine-specific DNA methylase n=1 Tax=Candidatus Kentrum sp. LFY TaxID=2126342 RepID=A0A450V8L9_9GAMM|nr:MAG: C-5 cytosine-specific DNA methylase [Candidatus Kentron sp. LFY]